jgi:hypothetical protein
MKSTKSSKGQLTVPLSPQARHPVDELFGCLDLGKPVDELLDEMRGPRLKAGKNKRFER